jgi:hypothetical protein
LKLALREPCPMIRLSRDQRNMCHPKEFEIGVWVCPVPPGFQFHSSFCQ